MDRLIVLEEAARRLLVSAEEMLAQLERPHNPNPGDCLRCYAERKLEERCRMMAEVLKS